MSAGCGPETLKPNLIKDLIYQKFNDKLIHVSGYKKVSRFDLGVHVAKIMNSKIKITKKDYRESKLKLFKDSFFFLLVSLIMNTGSYNNSNLFSSTSFNFFKYSKLSIVGKVIL